MRASYDLTQESNKLYISLNQLFFNVIRILTKHMTCFIAEQFTVFCQLLMEIIPEENAPEDMEVEVTEPEKTGNGRIEGFTVVGS